MVADRREKIADCIHFITEKAALEKRSQVEAGGDEMFRQTSARSERAGY